MATWLEVAQDNRSDAQELLDSGCFRSSISRSYFAAYAAVTHLLIGKVTFASGRRNPAHDDMLDYIMSNLSGVPVSRRRNARRAYRVLWKARVDADYRPGMTCDRATARAAKANADRVFREVGIGP